MLGSSRFAVAGLEPAGRGGGTGRVAPATVTAACAGATDDDGPEAETVVFGFGTGCHMV